MVMMPATCSDEVACMLSSLGYGFSPSERVEDGRRIYGLLRSALQIEQVNTRAGMKEVKPCSPVAPSSRV